LNYLFEKYYGNEDLIHCDEFWDDVLIHLKEGTVTLPVEYLPENVRFLQEQLECTPGTCGECCRYGITPIIQRDIDRLLKTVPMDTLQNCIYTRPDKTTFMRGEPAGTDCPLMKNNVCTVYEKRPDVCWIYPIQGASKSRMIIYRIKCKPSVDVIRKVFRGALHKEDKLLLPNLMIISKR
jgi:Fe-S-cluster containining protein